MIRWDRRVRRDVTLSRAIVASVAAGVSTPRDPFAPPASTRFDIRPRQNDHRVVAAPGPPVNNVVQRQRVPVEPTVVAIGGGGGGVGRSTVAVELGRYLARRGRRVLVVDADLAAPDVALRLDIDPATIPDASTDSADLDPRDHIVDGARKRPDVLSLAHAIGPRLGWPDLNPDAFVGRLRSSKYDEIIIDLPSGPDPVSTALWVLSDVPIVTAATEAVSLHHATRWLRAALADALLRHPRGDGREGELAALALAIPRLATAEALDAEAARRSVVDVLRAVQRDLQPYLVLTHTREAAERDLGPVVALAWAWLVGVRPRWLGPIDHDERRWFHVRQDQLCPPLGSERGTGVQLDDLGATLLDIHAVDRAQPRRHLADAQPIDLVGLPPDAEPLDVRQTWRRLWEGLRRDSALTRRLVPGPVRETMLRELEDANQTLQTWLAERTITGDEAPAPDEPRRHDPGRPIADARVAAGLGLRELSLRTKIGLRYLEAIERFEVEDLPRPVYLRGYLREVARALDLDPDPLLDDYLTALSDARQQRILTRRGGSNPS